ncbi:family 16 glycosylhydrolase [Flavobacteriaceae bacterium]|nr:family 16 glycosylhydrolase [Flavobacteriaceae bacterium]MDB2413852.1 family 16 glycosylhydrolase [Flavobacteriaceae bacterium]
MRFFLVFFFIFIYGSIVSQQIIEDDFEGSGTISLWVGDDCDVDSSFANPYVQGINTSSRVLKYTDVGGQYANVRFDSNENLDFSNNNSFTFKIYVPSSGITGNQTNKVSVKLQNGTLPQPWTTQSEIIKYISLNEWQEITFDFENDAFINLDPSSANPIDRTDFNRVLIQVNGEDNYDHVTAYVDDFIFEESEGGSDANNPVFNTLVWSDEFNYSGTVDSNKWHHQIIPIINGTDWANGELQHYTNQISNSFVSNGSLKIKAIRENYTYNNVTKPYTSARLNSKFAFKYGRVDVRAKLPAEAGTWPAIWTLGANINEVGNYFGSTYGSVGWPVCGEIDIMEQNGWDKTNLIGHLHYSNANTNVYQNEGSTTYIQDSSGEFHIYSLIWTENVIKILLDDVVFFERENTQEIPYDNHHYLLLNIAMGGNLGGAIPSNFNNATMEIDYVRVYEESSLSSSNSTLNELIIYPNPTKDKLILKTPSHLIGSNVNMYSTLGQSLSNFTLDEVNTSIDLSSFKKGIYLLKFQTDNGSFVKEIIKN